MPFQPTPLPRVRHAIARAVLESPEGIDDQLGTITLREHQRRTAARLASMITEHGGALLAEPVGLGKTFSALAVAARLGGELLIATPAALRTMWEQALRDCGIAASLVTHEALSRGARPSLAASLVIVDEAHRFRSPSAQRYSAMAEICRRARVLLVTATPMQNRRHDLAAQLALFVGRRAWGMTDEELAQFVVRGDAAETAELPLLSGPHARSLRSDDDCLDDILAIPPPVPARDGAIAAALLAFGLVHQWSSSRAALVAALKRRRARGVALASALETGRRPTRAELSAWTQGEDAVQLAFPELVAHRCVESGEQNLDSTALERTIANHNAAIEALLGRMRRSPNPDDERAALIREICAAHPGERVIAFCHYAETVNALYAQLRRFPGVAALTAAGARIASGRVSRDAVLAQFTPRTAHARPVSRVDRIDVLLTTDLLSEGLNLQEASVIVHLDLPWNPARLEQRVGRVRRLGSRFDTVTVYSIAPPAMADRLLGLDQRLREKIRLAQRTVGIAGRILPAVPLDGGVQQVERSFAESHGELRKRLATWCSADALDTAPNDQPLVAAAVAPHSGFLALVQTATGVEVVARLGSSLECSPAVLTQAVSMAEGRETMVDPVDAAFSIEQLEHWISARHAASMIDLRTAAASRARRYALSRVAQALARAPRHRRALLAPLAAAARAAAVAPLGEGAERILDLLVSAELPDEAWLRSIAAFAEMNARPSDDAGVPARARVIAVVQFAPR